MTMKLPFSKERLTEHLARATLGVLSRELIKLASSQNSASLSYCLPEPSNFMHLSFMSGLPQQKHTRAVSEKSWGKIFGETYMQENVSGGGSRAF